MYTYNSTIRKCHTVTDPKHSVITKLISKGYEVDIPYTHIIELKLNIRTKSSENNLSVRYKHNMLIIHDITPIRIPSKGHSV